MVFLFLFLHLFYVFVHAHANVHVEMKRHLGGVSSLHRVHSGNGTQTTILAATVSTLESTYHSTQSRFSEEEIIKEIENISNTPVSQTQQVHICRR